MRHKFTDAGTQPGGLLLTPNVLPYLSITRALLPSGADWGLLMMVLAEGEKAKTGVLPSPHPFLSPCSGSKALSSQPSPSFLLVLAHFTTLVQSQNPPILW